MKRNISELEKYKGDTINDDFLELFDAFLSAAYSEGHVKGFRQAADLCGVDLEEKDATQKSD